MCAKILLFLFVAFVGGYINTASSQWTAKGKYHNEAHPGKCFISETIILTPGEVVKPPGRCCELKCANTDGLVNAVGCIAVAAPPHDCQWGEYINIEAPYPECCAKHVTCNNPENQTMALRHEQKVLRMFQKNRERREAQRAGRAQREMHGTAEVHKEL